MKLTAAQKRAVKRERKNFSAATYRKVKREFDRQRVLPANAPTFRMTKTQWNAISTALGIAAETVKR